VDEFLPESGEKIHFLYLRQIVVTVMPDDEGHSLDGCLDFLRYLSLPASVSILRCTRSEENAMVHFPPTEYRELIQNIVILSHADYGDLEGRLEGVTIFAQLGIFDDFSPLHDICNQFFNIKSISLPSSWLRGHRMKLRRLINELHRLSRPEPDQ